ncbi:ATP synthase regulation protein NCA2-domain-containing protein [Aspergillus coremiiformis]|uniref:ATP synthase regulation protein NCA2-domain-containing protein n=1 Tax=Aspergillus coremiiformis TaxID=138285 RepID=A0A5N6YSC5_9EURO|nr:ATP synthase regulation protein NCA2-domain-containing protein [Aspergillus coremiiformis]
MSVVNVNICRLDAQLDQVKQQIHDLYLASLEFPKDKHDLDIAIKHISNLEHVIGSLSVTSKSYPMLPEHIVEFISKLSWPLFEPYGLLSDVSTERALEELMWLAVAKATLQALGTIMKTFLDHSLLFNDEIFYWDAVIGSQWRTCAYTLQTSPLRIWRRLIKSRPSTSRSGVEARFPTPAAFKWSQFYESIQRCFYARSLHALHANVVSPFVTAKLEMRRKREKLMAMKDFNASSIGLLMRECFPIQTNDDTYNSTKYVSADDHWRNGIARSVVLMETLLQKQPNDCDTFDFGEGILSITNKELTYLQTQSGDMCTRQAPELLIERLRDILLRLLPIHKTRGFTTVKKFGRPSRLVRCWLPFSVALLTTCTSLKILANHHHQLIQWAANAGQTTVDFWSNWVIEPIQRLVGTIKHDEKSEIALMSKNSLEADRSSLERMVVDFILDRDEQKALDINSIANKVREGDLTPVLRAYEKDLRSPFVGTVRGDLIRALLIQIQKTKVDVEIAIGGIDALLKSQELVFGFVGLTPGILVSYASLRWVWGLFGNRKGLRAGRQQDELRHALRNAHRTLILSNPTATGLLTYRNHGLLICETEVLLRKAGTLLKGADLRAFQEDIGDLINQKTVGRQLEIIGRMGWVYTKWMHR